MDEFDDKLKGVLDKFETDFSPLRESDVLHVIEGLINPDDKTTRPENFIAEAIAFMVHEDRTGEGTVWKTHFGPMMTYENGAEVPSLAKINEKTIGYWEVRAQSTKNPILRARYADLVWDLGKIATKIQPSHIFAQLAIDSYLEIARNHQHKDTTNIISKTERALTLALSLSDEKRVQQVAIAMMDLEHQVAEESKLGLWGFSYDNLIERKNSLISPTQEESIIKDLEQRLDVAIQSQEEHKDAQWAAEATALRLAKYYRRKQLSSEVSRVLLSYGTCVISACSDEPALRASAWLQKLHGNYISFGLNDEAESIAIKLRQLGEKLNSELKSISTTVEIPTEKIEEYIAEITAGTVGEALRRLTLHNIPNIKQAQEQMNRLAKEAPLSAMIPREILDGKGRPVAKLGSQEDDPDGRLVNHVSQELYFSTFFIHRELETIISKSSDFAKAYVDHLFLSPIFEDKKRPFIELAIREYLDRKYITSVHLLVPQIESTIRTLYEKAGGSVLKVVRDGSFNLKILDELLRDTILPQVLNEDTVLYFRVLLTDQRGWNIRNNVCHGLYEVETQWEAMADRLVHVLLCLSLVRQKEPTGGKADH